MPEVPEVYSDLFTITLSPYTAAFLFDIREVPPAAQPEREAGQPPGSRRVAVVRMSPEHAKIMGIILRRHIQKYEQDTGITIDVPVRILQELNIPPEDWRQFGR